MVRICQREKPRTCWKTSGFVLAEVAAILIIFVLSLVLAALMLPDSQRRARLAGSLGNLSRLTSAMKAYADDSGDRVATFSWRGGVPHTCEDGYAFPTAPNDNQAMADQTVCLLRHVFGRSDITQITAFIPGLYYSSMVMSEYLDDSLPSSFIVSPGDRYRLQWQRALVANPEDPNGPYWQLACRPAYPAADNANKRWPYSSSYELPPCLWGPDAIAGGVPTVAQGDTHRVFTTGNELTPLGRRLVSEIKFPSQKAVYYETFQRFFGGRELFFAFPEARVPIALGDGSAVVRVMSKCNNGFMPNAPQASAPTVVAYTPETTWEEPIPGGQTQLLTNGRIRWTRSGMRGRDFGGPEIPWQ